MMLRMERRSGTLPNLSWDIMLANSSLCSCDRWLYVLKSRLSILRRADLGGLGVQFLGSLSRSPRSANIKTASPIFLKQGILFALDVLLCEATLLQLQPGTSHAQIALLKNYLVQTFPQTLKYGFITYNTS